MKQKNDLHSGNSLISEWLTAPEDLSLNSNEVHLWRASLDIPDEQIEKLIKTLSPEERKKSEESV
jgi:hypothetical protein